MQHLDDNDDDDNGDDDDDNGDDDDDDDDDDGGDYDDADADGVHGVVGRRGCGWGGEMLGGEGRGVMGVNCNASAG